MSSTNGFVAGVATGALALGVGMFLCKQCQTEPASKEADCPKVVDKKSPTVKTTQQKPATESGESMDSKSIEKARRMKHFHPPETPIPGSNATLKEKEAYAKYRQSLAKASAVVNALTEMHRDRNANEFMDMAVEEASMGVVTGEGGPFGAVITQIDKTTGEETMVARAHNMVLQTNDPTAHAEVTCIRKACGRLGRFDLKDCKLYTSCYPCPMCYGAIHWAKIPHCVYAAEKEDAADAGFDDAFIYESIRETADVLHCDFVSQPHQGALDVFKMEFGEY